MPVSSLRLDNVYALGLEPRKSVPLLRGWNRLEGRPRITDFERSLKAEVRDPLWFLTRQWQFGEFQGEDAASPIDVALGVRFAPLATMRVGATDVPYDPSIPIETRVEREPPPADLMFHMQGSRFLNRLLVQAKLEKLLPKFVSRFPLLLVPGEPSPDADRLRVAGSGFLVDIVALLATIRDGKFDPVVAVMTTNQTDAAALKKVGDDLASWFDKIYGASQFEPSAWQPDRLSYQFGCQTAAGPDAVSLNAEQYRGAALDWHSFDAATPAAAPGPPCDAATLSFLPAGIEFAGMPSARFWEMENGRTEFGHIDANTNDAAKLIVAEFVLLFGNDWCIVPLELSIGSFARVDGVLVTDVFGDQTWVRSANRGAGADWHRWSMYLLTGDDAASPGLFLAPAVTATVEAPPIEQVQFIRDEMANMVWAIEKRVISDLGDGVLLATADVDGENALSRAAETRYLLGTSVPGYWRPFLPVHVPGSVRSIRLQRARMPGIVEEPKAEVLRFPGPYFIEEEEVPRAGRVVQRAFQRTRWHDGKTFLWVGRRSEAGRGEGSSGLAFDHILERGEQNIG